MNFGAQKRGQGNDALKWPCIASALTLVPDPSGGIQMYNILEV